MRQTILSIILVVFFVTLVGCVLPDREERFMVDPPEPAILQTTPKSATAEVGIAEKLIVKRQAYRDELEVLQAYYKDTGNNVKLQWVQKELESLASAPRYRYIINAEIAGPDLRATEHIAEADRLFDKAIKHYKKAKQWIVVADKDQMRLALSEFNRLIKEYPTSDKIDDAAYRAGRIYDYFGDHVIAVLYYERTFQWDADTIYPARYRAAHLLDYRLQQRTKALKLYQESVKHESKHTEFTELAKERITELTASITADKSVEVE